jgi:hypothetical protein
MRASHDASGLVLPQGLSMTQPRTFASARGVLEFAENEWVNEGGARIEVRR